MIHYFMIVNQQCVVRVARFYRHIPEENRKQLQEEVSKLCLVRSHTQSTILDYEDYTVVYRRFGNMLLVAGVTKDENELAVMELFQHFVETLNKYFGKITELHIIYNLDKVYMILDEMILNGHVAETCQARILAPLQLMSTAKR